MPVRPFIIGLLFLCAAAQAADLDYGKPGDPIHLVVGYQPYYTQSWSGVVMRGKRFFERYLPRGSKVEFNVALQGSKIVDGMQAGRLHIGYTGDAPTLAAAAQGERADVRMVAVLGMSFDQCNNVLVRADAPRLSPPRNAVRWLNSRRVASPRGSCSDRFAQAVFKRENIRPAAYLNRNIEVITSYLRTRQLDGAVIWEPVASRLVEEGVAQRVATGADFGEADGGFLVMRADLIRQRPDVAQAWLEAELDAQLFLADPDNAEEVVEFAFSQTAGYSKQALWSALYGIAGDKGTPRLSLPFAFTPEAMALVERVTATLQATGTPPPRMPSDLLAPELAQEVLKSRRLKAPVGQVMAQAVPAKMVKGRKGDPYHGPGVTIHVLRGGWGDAKPEEIHRVLHAVADAMLSRFPGKPLNPIVVARSDKTPISLYERGPNDAYQIFLTARDRRWGAYVYEFAHEFGHVLSNYLRHPHHAMTRRHQWFEEALCEVASLHTLRHLASEWERAPPQSEWAAYAPQLREYAERFLNEAHRRLPPGMTLAEWYRQNYARLGGSAYDRSKNEVVANQLLPLFEENPEIWEAIAYLNLDAPGPTFQDYLQNWYDNAPDEYRDVIRYTMNLFGLMQPAGVAGRRTE